MESSEQIPSATPLVTFRLVCSAVYFGAGLWQLLSVGCPMLEDAGVQVPLPDWMLESFHRNRVYRDGAAFVALSGCLLVLVSWWLFPFGKNRAAGVPMPSQEPLAPLPLKRRLMDCFMKWIFRLMTLVIAGLGIFLLFYELAGAGLVGLLFLFLAVRMVLLEREDARLHPHGTAKRPFIEFKRTDRPRNK
jgi:hypothetical protein